MCVCVCVCVCVYASRRLPGIKRGGKEEKRDEPTEQRMTESIKNMKIKEKWHA